MSQQNVINLYQMVCDCRSKKCAEFQEILNAPTIGSPPRGFYTNATYEAKVMVVGKNPGHVLKSEAVMYKSLTGNSLVKAHLEFSKITFFKLKEVSKEEKPSTKFHSNLVAYLTEIMNVDKELIFDKVVYTNLVKCSTNGSKQNTLTIRSMNECYKNHLVREIEFFKPKIIFALGREVERYLKKLEKIHHFAVLYLKHPSYHYRKDMRHEKLMELKEKYNEHLRAIKLGT